jgi:heme exporter protein C
MKKNWWKILGVLLTAYSLIAGFLLPVPEREILNETIRNLYFHVPMWFSMMTIMGISVVYSVMFLSGYKIKNDIVAASAANTGMLLGALGLATGSLWARFTWGAWWTSDVKLNGAAITMLIYFAYFVLRGSIDEEQKRARIAAVYNIFAFVMLIVFLNILPRMTDSLHPGMGGNPGFKMYDLDSTMRTVFYPAVLGWILLSVWVLNIKVRIEKLKYNLLNEE